jgi:hypothetical protein
MDRTRRRVLTALGAVGAACLAGCSSGDFEDTDGTDATGATATATAPPESPYVTDDATIDYPGMVDGAAAVTERDETTLIEYRNPPREFRLVSGFEGETDPSELRASRDLAVDARAGFVAPIYDPDAEAFVYQVFANEAFVEYADWHVVTVDGDGDVTEEGTAPFERAQGDVYAAGVRPGDVRRLFVVDTDAETLQSQDGTGLSGIVVLVGSAATTPTPTPTGAP